MTSLFCRCLRLIPVILSLAVLSYGCGSRHGAHSNQPDPLFTGSVRDLVALDSISQWDKPLPMSDSTERMKVNHIGQLHREFNDSNYIHWAAADSIGITPLSDLRSHWQLRRPLVKITSCRDFYLEPLTHSVPYLVPEAAEMVHEIGRRFTDSVAARCNSSYRMRITSVTRTPETVRRLRRRNVNAVDSSVHQLATTVDISYARFIPGPDNTVARSVDDLKGVLAEVIAAMRDEGKLYVKYERKQPCFHITVRPGAYLSPSRRQ
ncbi:MAG: DUF5715 family protein [Pseudoflavonifractor sp.]|nr:DUF5715 family protein [Alloprevotella sp.]MCM1116707.1 DUF5715 family protein [Pseudoflavonifractor sp.]